MNTICTTDIVHLRTTTVTPATSPARLWASEKLWWSVLHLCYPPMTSQRLWHWVAIWASPNVWERVQEGRLQDGLSNDPVRKAASSLYIRSFSLWSSYSLDHSFPGGSEVKVSSCNAGDLGSIPGLGRSPREGNGNPLQYSCLENPMDGEAWGPQSMGSQRVGHNWATLLSLSLSSGRGSFPLSPLPPHFKNLSNQPENAKHTNLHCH